MPGDFNSYNIFDDQECIFQGWRFSSVILLPVLQAKGPEFDPYYKKKKIFHSVWNFKTTQL